MAAFVGATSMADGFTELEDLATLAATDVATNAAETASNFAAAGGTGVLNVTALEEKPDEREVDPQRREATVVPSELLVSFGVAKAPAEPPPG